MKKYGKLTYKTFQIRLSEEENESLQIFIKKFKKSRREFILAAMNTLKNETIIRDNQFWRDNKEYAYNSNTIHKAEKPKHCELCNDKFRKDEILVSHHYLGYDDENAHKTKELCNKCHGFCHRKECNGKTWEEIEKLHKNWDGKNRMQ